MSNEVKLNVSQSRGYENANLELIKVTTNEQGQQLVSGRELHQALKVQQDFTDWIKKQLGSVDAVENEDFTRFPFKREGNNATLYEYVLTLDIAKEICMCVGVSPRTNEETRQLSKQIRKYFIECEKVAHNPYAHLSKELQMMIKLEQGQTQLDQRLMKLENNMTIDYGQQLEIQNAVSRAAIKALGGYDSYAYRTKTVNRKTFNAIYKMLKTTFQVNSYKNISTKNFEVAKELIATWKPNEDLVLMIRGANAQMLLGDVI